MNTIIILGSAGNDGDTMKVSTLISEKIDCSLLNLNQYRIAPYDYSGIYENDDFIHLMEEVILKQDHIIFATPVYWYAMSGVMKQFFDRFTDLITIRKDLGRKLAGKQVHVITTSSGDHLAEQFWLPFQKTCDYLNMEFKGGYHFKNTIPLDLEIENFIKESKLNVEL